MAGRSRQRGYGYVRRLPSGRWQASYMGPDLVRRSAPHTFDAKGDAEAWLGQWRLEVATGERRPPVRVEPAPALTFDASSAQWLRERGLEPLVEHLDRVWPDTDPATSL